MSTLNPAQQSAATVSDGPALVLAGAGTGKTRVIVERLAWLIGERRVEPWRILALTFTNRAAKEMRERVAARLGQDRAGVWLGTFHSFGLYFLRREFGALGRKTAFTIFDDSDQLSLMKRLVKDLPSTFEAVSPREALNWISLHKQGLDRPAVAADAPPAELAFAELARRYEATLERASGVDFDDMLVYTARILSEDAGVCAKYRDRFRYIHVDEYQDTNRAQYAIARQLAGEAGNLFVVGDEDQSIYSWRGATIRNILDFERDFPAARVLRLEQNYRSTAPILNAANAVVANNVQRLGKTLFTETKVGEPVRFYLAPTGDDEARYLVEQVSARGLDPRTVAVLYRTNAQARPIEEALRRAGMAYRVVGGIQFYARKEVKDLIAYLRLLVNPADDLSLLRIVNVPTRGLGESTLEQARLLAKARACPLLEVLREMQDDQSVPGRARNAIAAFVELIDDFTLQAKTAGAGELVEALIAETGYRDHIQRSDERDFKTRLEIVDEFVNACDNFDAKAGEGGILEFLQDLALVSDADDLPDAASSLTLMTCHSAKGLEFDHVFLIGLEEGLLPHANALEDGPGVEEERRLCYVAMTRARQSLTLTAAEERLTYGKWSEREVSRFVAEIPGLARVEAARDVAPAHTPEAGPRLERKAAPTDAAPAVKIGTRVRHAKFGRGVVMFTRGSGTKARAKIRFDTGPAREFVLSLAPLEILEK